MDLAHFRLLVHELLNEDPDMVPKEAPLIVLDSKSSMCMAKNGRDTILSHAHGRFAIQPDLVLLACLNRSVTGASFIYE